ncbi:MAG: hypothetical protein WDO18_06390 [Acidobacteriota bacterium]
MDLLHQFDSGTTRQLQIREYDAGPDVVNHRKRTLRGGGTYDNNGPGIERRADELNHQWIVIDH